MLIGKTSLSASNPNPDNLTSSSVLLERYSQIYFAIRPDRCTEDQLRRCPTLRGPTRR